MKRSEINAIIEDTRSFLDSMNCKLPPWGYWSPKQWKENSGATKEIEDTMLGWDITDFGGGDIKKMGLVIFTFRNGSQMDKSYHKPYCEKALIVDNNQVLPLHFHWSKMEDIINRGGGNLAIEIYNSTTDEGLSDEPVTVGIDGIYRTVPAGGRLTLKPGESITLLGGVYHRFWAEGGRVLLGEVSTVNDDTRDNRFYDVSGRFPKIEEDEAPQYLLAMDYPVFLHGKEAR